MNDCLTLITFLPLEGCQAFTLFYSKKFNEKKNQEDHAIQALIVFETFHYYTSHHAVVDVS